MSFRTSSALLAIIALLAIASWVFTHPEGDAKAERFITVDASRGSLIARVTATGTLAARITVQVGSQVSGRIQSLHADFNSPVEKGEVIARLDPQLFEAAALQADANLAAAEGNRARAEALAADAERQAQRAQDLFGQKLISQAERDTARANAESSRAGVAAAEGAVAQARAAQTQARINLAYTVIRSPTRGVVISRNVDVGQTVAAALQAPTLFTIAEDLRTMQVHTSVAESDVGKLREGMHATFTVDAYPGESFKGRVQQVRNAPQVIQNVVTYNAVIDVDNADLRLKPGMTANVSFVYARRDDALRVPNAALRFRAPADWPKPPRDEVPGARTLWVLRENQPVAITVTTGVSDGTQTEITGGELVAGDRLITDLPSDKPKSPQAPVRLGF